MILLHLNEYRLWSIIIIILKEYWQHEFPWPSLAIHPYQSLLLVSPLNDTKNRWMYIFAGVSMCSNP